MGHIIEIRCIHKQSTKLSKYRKVSKTEYVDVDSGELKEYQISTNRSENQESLAFTFRSIRDLINNNFKGQLNELFHTLTYQENMTDTERLYKDFKRFWMRYRRRYGINIDYLSIVEPQGRGAWHIHLLVRHNDKEKVFIPNDEIREMWGHGKIVSTKSLNNVDNIGAYLSAYLANVELTDENVAEAAVNKSEIITREIDGTNKHFIKGARLKMYPPGMNIYRHSKGIKHPIVEKMNYKKAKKIVRDATPNHSSTVTIYQDDKFLNKISYEQYNLKRNDKKV